jgi:SAM-dependent methyltransferase
MNESHVAFLASPAWAAMLETDLWPWVEAAGDLGDDVLEIGPGPGLTTDFMRRRVARLTAIEIDPALADPLRARLAGTNVEVLCGDGADTGLPAGRFTGATIFSVFHHIPSVEHQDRVLAEIRRLLRPGGVLVGADALDLDQTRAGHAGDTFVPADPETFPERLRGLGFDETTVDVGEYQFRFVAR